MLPESPWEELQRMTNRMRERYSSPEYIAGEAPARTYVVNIRMEKKLNEWLNQHYPTCVFRPTEANPFPAGAIGGVLTTSFTDTTLGQICKVRCACGAETDLTEYEDW